jgi:hypothetical protein
MAANQPTKRRKHTIAAEDISAPRRSARKAESKPEPTKPARGKQNLPKYYSIYKTSSYTEVFCSDAEIPGIENVYNFFQEPHNKPLFSSRNRIVSIRLPESDAEFEKYSAFILYHAMIDGQTELTIDAGKIDACNTRKGLKTKFETFAKELKKDWERRKLPIPNSITMGKIRYNVPSIPYAFRPTIIFEGKGFGVKKSLPKALPPNSVFMGSIIDREEGEVLE